MVIFHLMCIQVNIVLWWFFLNKWFGFQRIGSIYMYPWGRSFKTCWIYMWISFGSLYLCEPKNRYILCLCKIFCFFAFCLNTMSWIYVIVMLCYVIVTVFSTCAKKKIHGYLILFEMYVVAYRCGHIAHIALLVKKDLNVIMYSDL